MRSQRYVKFLVYLVAIVLINLVGINLFFRVDLTAGDKYSLSPASREAVAGLSEPLTIKVFFTKNLPPPHNTTERYLHDLLEAYAVSAGEHFNYRFYNVTSDGGDPGQAVSTNQELAREYGIHPVQVQNIESDEVKVKQAYMGMVILHGDMTEKISPLDSTAGLEYRITSGIRKLTDKISTFLSLEQPVKVRLFLSSSLYPVAPYMNIETLEDLPETMGGIVERMNSRLAGRLEFEAVDPSDAPERLADVRDENLVRLQWPQIARQDGPPVPAGEGVVGLVLNWKDKRLTLPLLDVVEIPLFGTQYSLPTPGEMETLIDESLESLVGVNDDVGYLADHGTLSMDPAAMMRSRSQSPDQSLASFRSLVEDSYTIDEVNLAGENLGGEFECLVIARPTAEFTDYELFQIDQYLMRGHNLALFLDQFQAKYPRGQSTPYAQPSYVPVETGLKKLLSHYGVKIEDAVVMDESCYTQRAERFGGGGEQPIYFAPVIKNKHINNTPAFMSNIKGLVTMKVSPLQIDPDRLAENGITATTLFSSSDQSWAQRERVTFNPMFIRPPAAGEERQSFPLACLLEGEFPSYFAGRKIPVRKTDQGEQDPAGKGDDTTAVTAADRLIEKGEPARIFVMGSSQMLADHMLDREGRFPNSIFIMNLLDSLNNRDQMAVLRSKQQAYNPISEVSGSVKSLIKWVNIAGLPVLVLLSGLVVMAVRSARKRRIRMMFAA